MDDVIERLGQWLSKHCPKQLERLAPGLTDDEITVYERKLGVTFPASMRALYRWRNGLLPEFSAADIIGRYSLMSLDKVVSNQKMMNDLLEQNAFKTKNWWRKTWIPIFDKGTGDYLCWDPRGSFSGELGQVLDFWHTDHDRNILAPSFDGYLTAYVDSLDAGLWSYTEADGFDDNSQFEDFLGERFPEYPYRAITFEGKRPRPPAPRPATVEAAPDREIKPYSVATTYEIGDQVQHPQFGVGVVQAVELAKADIQFGDERRMLVHARGESEKLERPKRIDHTKQPPPKF